MFLLQFKDSNGPDIHWSNLLWIFPTNIFWKRFSSNWIPPNWLFLFSYCTSKFLFIVVVYLNPFKLIFPLLPLQYYFNLLSIFSAKVFAFQWENLILHNFSFNWKVAGATQPLFSTIQGWEIKVQVPNCLIK